MTIKEFIEAAIEGGWKSDQVITIRQMLVFGGEEQLIMRAVLDPKAWQAVGKVKGWVDGGFLIQDPYASFTVSDVHFMFKGPQWQALMCEMSLELSKGKTLEEYIATL